ncbi:hypothetical protein LTR28_007694, partial [Elasticomyces elasticus]
PTPHPSCIGIDLDRAYGFHWDNSSGGSESACSESYAGPAAFAAAESRALADWARNATATTPLVGFLDLHSYSQQILYPYSYSCARAPPGLENLEELAQGLAKAIRRGRGRAYEVAQACRGHIAAAAAVGDGAQPPQSKTNGGGGGGGGGSALDYFHHDLHVRYAYQIRLRDRGTYGFLLPKEHILPSGREMFDALMYFGRYLGLEEGLVEEAGGAGG